MKKHWIFLGVCMLPICLWAGDDGDFFDDFDPFNQGAGDEGPGSHSEEASDNEEEKSNKQESPSLLNTITLTSQASQPISFSLDRDGQLQEEVSPPSDEKQLTALSIYASIQAARKLSNNANGFGSLPVSLTRQSSRSSANPELNQTTSANPELNQTTQSLSITLDPSFHFDAPPIKTVPPIVSGENNVTEVNESLLPVIVPPNRSVQEPKSKLFVPKKHTSEYNTFFDFEDEVEVEDRATDNQSSEDESEEEDQPQTDTLPVLPRGVPNETQEAPNWRSKALARAGVVPVPNHTHNNGPRISSSAPIAIGVNWGGSPFK